MAHTTFLLFYVALFLLQFTDATVPAMFIFGDSTADVGTNNFLSGSRAKADHPYYGIDFPGGKPTGRFSNGFNSVDFVAKYLGFERSPPPYLFLRAKGTSYYNKHIAKGVNFASAGSGILEQTGEILGEVVPMAKQVQQFEIVVKNLTEHMGSAATEQLLSKSLFAISVGSNDILEFNIFNTHPTPYQTKQFMATLKNKYEDYLRTLFNLGARKFGIVSVPPVGCCPAERIQNKTGGCLEDLNRYTRMFYSTISQLMQYLKSEFKGMMYSLANADEMVATLLKSPRLYGFEEVQSACCGGGRLNGEYSCDPNSDLCTNRDEYLFWDAYHPTEAACKQAAFTLYYAPPQLVSPINFKELADS